MLLLVANDSIPTPPKKGRACTWHDSTSYRVSSTARRLFPFDPSWCLPAYDYSCMTSSLPDRRRAPLCYIWYLVLHPLSLVVLASCTLFHPCPVHPLQVGTVCVQIWHTKDPGLKDPVTVFFRPWSCFSPAIPRYACYFFFLRPTADHGRPPFIAPCPDAMMLDPIPVVPYIFRWA